jgi:hypothetical protein
VVKPPFVLQTIGLGSCLTSEDPLPACSAPRDPEPSNEAECEWLVWRVCDHCPRNRHTLDQTEHRFEVHPNLFLFVGFQEFRAPPPSRPKLPYRSTHFRIGMMDMTGANKRSDDETGVLWPELLQPALTPRRHLRIVGPVPLPRKSAIHRAGEAWGPNFLVLARSFPGWDTARDRTRRCGPAGLHVSLGVYQQGWQQVAKTEFAKREATTRGSSQV